jgi:hypothetical protein
MMKVDSLWLRKTLRLCRNQQEKLAVGSLLCELWLRMSITGEWGIPMNRVDVLAHLAGMAPGAEFEEILRRLIAIDFLFEIDGRYGILDHYHELHKREARAAKRRNSRGRRNYRVDFEKEAAHPPLHNSAPVHDPKLTEALKLWTRTFGPTPAGSVAKRSLYRITRLVGFERAADAISTYAQWAARLRRQPTPAEFASRFNDWLKLHDQSKPRLDLSARLPYLPSHAPETQN